MNPLEKEVIDYVQGLIDVESKKQNSKKKTYAEFDDIYSFLNSLPIEGCEVKEVTSDYGDGDGAPAWQVVEYNGEYFRWTWQRSSWDVPSAYIEDVELVEKKRVITTRYMSKKEKLGGDEEFA